jgi:hypothetical protein
LIVQQRQFIDRERQFIDRERQFIDRERQFVVGERQFVVGERQFVGRELIFPFKKDGMQKLENVIYRANDLVLPALGMV